MSKKTEALQRRIEKTQRELFLNGLHQTVYCAKKRPGKPTMTAVLHRDRKVVE